MKIILTLLSMVAAIIAIRGDTWHSEQQGLKKISKAGLALFWVAVLSASLSIYIDFEEWTEIKDRKVNSLDNISRELHGIELLFSQIEQNKDVELLLSQLRLHVDLLENNIETNSQVLDSTTVHEISVYLRLIKSEIEELTFGKQFLNDSPAIEVSKFARELRFKYCEMILLKSGFCYQTQANLTAHEFFKRDDPKIINAINSAKLSFVSVIKHRDWIEESGAELSVKVIIPFGDGTYEHIWINSININEDNIVGEVANNTLSGFVNLGDTYITPMRGVEDWMLYYNGKMYGGFMLRVDFERMPISEIKSFKKKFKYIIQPIGELPPWEA
ncbi:DUF2314 domain-containing protein [Vibrio sp. WJH972]